ncbi:GSCFA family protein [Jannaschia rubra]|uniref:GSCFA family protein n=1 Tax=Jannaschia rubra TaxID=282197 RepID=A0A0M6XKE2_9RHOB|nr:GSCFA family protein [Jannaschia rubra]SFF77077.1 GSCFA family protein [Jannaschia rubra]
MRQAIETMDVFVFTLGPTECWTDPVDGAVWPRAPGVSGGVDAPGWAVFRNFDEVETTADLLAALRLIRERNPQVRILLTVSPVPRSSTFEDRHVAVLTAWFKAVLRIAAERAVSELPDCAYFRFHEIITAPHTRVACFDPDERGVLPAGVAHVMRLFFHHLAGAEWTAPDVMQDAGGAEGAAPVRALSGYRRTTARPTAQTDAHTKDVDRRIQIICDEERID